MRPTSLAVGLALCAVVASCTLDFVAPGPGSPIAQLTLRLEQGFLEGDSLQVTADLDPGVGADNLLSDVPDPHLDVLGASLPADSTSRDERLVLHWSAVLPADSAYASPLAIRAPAVSGRALPAPVTVALRREAEGSGRRTWAAGEELSLPLSPASEDTGLDDAVWNLAVSGWDTTGAAISLVTLSVHSTVGDTLRVPAEWLPGIGLDSLMARLRYTRYLSSKSADGSYMVNTVVDQSLSWMWTTRAP
ncbi:MAG: hypothetical protein LJF04_15875 [Gemmatimonadetes bacterium]|nr:hypothetical protein [Gemmatimonadota bacterium]